MSFISELNTLIDKYKHVIDLDEIGFPDDWFIVLSK